MTDQPQIGHGSGAHFIRVLHRLLAHFHGHLLYLCRQRCQRVSEFLHRGILGVQLHQIRNDLAELHELGTHVTQNLAPQQIQRLNGVGSFVDHVDAGIAHMLLETPFRDVSMTAQNLHGQCGGFVAVIGDKAFHHWRQQSDQVCIFLAYFLVRMLVLAINCQARPVGEGARSFHIGLLRQQHPAHIWMHDDGIGDLVLCLRT